LPLVDPWLASSLLQKAIRRGEAELAEQAAVTLFRFRGSAIWKRFLVVTIEDAGIACPDVLINVAAICHDRVLRRNLGGDKDAARYLARKLAAAPKDRSADLLASTVCYHPTLKAIRHQVQHLTLQERRYWLRDASRSLYERAVAAWFASGIATDHKRRNSADLVALLATFEDLGVPPDLIEAIAGAASRTKEQFCTLVPLLLFAAQSGSPHKTVSRPLPQTRTIGGLPLWTLDFHTRTGRTAIQAFIRENEAIRQVLQESVLHNRHTEAAYLGAFYTDAAPCAMNLDWPLKAEIEQRGVEADFAHAGVSPDHVGPLLAAFESHIDHLNDIRENVLVRYLEGA
jgi:hypothetical protein